MAATIGVAMTTPGQTVGVSVFVDRIVESLNISRPTVSLLYAIGTLGGSLALPFVGRAIDRYGPRLAVVAISLLFAGGCVWMGWVQGTAMLLVGFILIRSLGQGSLTLVSLHAISLWFVRRRGTALGLAGLGMAGATAIFPRFIEFLLEQFGWRVAYQILGGVVAIAMLPIGALFYRNRPELFGLQPDGGETGEEDDPPDELNYTASQARRIPIFWLFALANVCAVGLGTGLVFHHYSIMAASGASRELSATMFVPFGFVMAGANVLVGFLMDRVSPRWLLMGMLLLLSLALAVAPNVSTTGGMLAYGSVLGLMQGSSVTLNSGVYAYYFGRSHIGAINGFASTLSVAGTAFGPILLATGYEYSGSYAPILFTCAIVPLAIAIAAPFVPAPPRS